MINRIKSLIRRHKIKQKVCEQEQEKKTIFYSLSETCQIPNLAHLYQKYFGVKTNGVFVEIGAFDGEYVSNTSGLADIGWTGYYYEPIKIYYEKCRRRHQKNKHIKVLNYAIGAEEKEVEINISGPLSSIDKGVVANFKKLSWSRNLITSHFEKVKQITLDQAITSEGVKQGFDLLVIDVEGYEWEVMKKFDLKRWEPRMVIIELHDQNPDYPDMEEQCINIVKLFEDDYRIVYKDFRNTVYVKK